MVAYPLDTYTLTHVDLGAFGIIRQIESQRLDPGIQQLLLSSSGEIDATYVGTIKSNPRISFTTTDIKNALDLITLQGKVIPFTAEVATLWFMKRAELAIATGSVHIKMVIANGLIVPRPITATDGQPARMEIEIIPVDATVDANDPIVITNSEDGPTIDTADQGVINLWTAGSAVLNGDKLPDLVTSITIDPGISVNPVSGSGGLYPRLAQIIDRRPTIALQTQQGRTLFDFKLIGAIRSGVTRVYLRHTVKGGGVVPDATATHIEFDVAEGMITAESSNAQHGGNADFTVKITPSFDGTNQAIALDTASAINEA